MSALDDTPDPRRRRMLAGAAAGLVLVLLAALLYEWRARPGADEEEEADPVVAVKVAAVARRSVSTSVTAVGTVEAKAQAVVSPKIGAALARMERLVNRPVRQGDVLAVLESNDLRAALREAEAAVAGAEAEARQARNATAPEASAQTSRDVRDAEAALRSAEALHRRRLALYEKGGIAKKDLEDAELQLEQARSALELARRESAIKRTSLNPTTIEIAEAKAGEARQRAASARASLEYATVRSPIAGVVTEQFHQQGDFVAAGEKLVTVADIGEVIVKAQFPDTQVAGIEPGANAKLEPSGGEEGPMFGTVRLVSRAADPASRTVEVWVAAVNGDYRLRPGEFAKVTIVTEEAEDVLSVPASAVTLEDPSEDAGTVMAVDAGSVAREVEVTVGVRGEEAYEITGGLHEGQSVIVEGNYALPDGTKVRAVEAGEGDETEGEEEGDEKDGGGGEKGGGAGEKDEP